MKLLLVEDDSLLGSGLRAALGRAGFAITWVRDGKSALDQVRADTFIAVVLDLGLPDASGLDVLRQMRADGLRLPVLILTARDSTHDKVVGLEAGADDYVVKTADMEELVARLRALVRRTTRGGGGVLRQGDLVLDLEAHSLTRGGVAVSLSRREFEVLRALMEGAGRVLTRTQLEQALYGWSHSVDSNAIEVHIHNLRLKLGAQVLKTVRGIGYVMAPSG
jgi:two-component system OmpR family response regulator/two-component system response regulator QseB